MKNIKLLDCTLRDGGSLNNGMFGYANIMDIFSSLNDAGIDIIETGFIDNNSTENENAAISPDTYFFNRITAQIKNKKCKSVAMIDFSKFNRKNFNIAERKNLDGIRIMFKKEQIKEVLDFSITLKNLNYEIALNPVSITTYTKKEIIGLLKQADILKPDIVYIVDTYGLLDGEETLKYYNLFEEYLNSGISIGYHAHNNRQLAFANSIEIIKHNNSGRQTVIDTALYGMGKRAGNTPTELLADYLNKYNSSNYNTDIITNIINDKILPLKNSYTWGYSLIHYIAAINKCHSDYVNYLYNEKHFPITAINNILNQLQPEKKLTFDKDCIENIAINYRPMLEYNNFGGEK